MHHHRNDRKKWNELHHRPNPYVRPLRPLAASHSLPGSGGIPIEVNERLSHLAAYSELCRGISRLSLDAYCRWNMFDEGEKELTIFIPVASGAVSAGRDGVFQVVNGDGVKRERRKRAKGTGAKGESVSCCTSRYGELAKRLQRQAFRRLRWCSNSPMWSYGYLTIEIAPLCLSLLLSLSHTHTLLYYYIFI